MASVQIGHQQQSGWAQEQSGLSRLPGSWTPITTHERESGGDRNNGTGLGLVPALDRGSQEGVFQSMALAEHIQGWRSRKHVVV